MEQRKSIELVFDEEENVAERNDKNYSLHTYSTQSFSSGKSFLQKLCHKTLFLTF